jgi:hypothetical protein
MKKIISIICLVSTLIANGQNKITKQIEKFNLSVLSTLQQGYNNTLEGFDLNNFDLKIIPSFYAFIDEKKMEHYELDTTEWTLFGISKDSKDTISIYYDKGRISYSRNKPLNEFIILHKSAYCFYIYFLKKEPYSRNKMGYIKNEKVEIEDFMRNKYKNLTEVIIYYFGSIEKAWDIVKFEKFERDFLKSTSVNEAKEILRNSYTDCYRLYPKDTLLLLETYLNELEATIHLYEGQKEFLNRLIQKHIRIKDRDTIKNPEYDYFMDIFISWDLFTTLTIDQYYDFKKNKSTFSKKVQMSRDILHNYYINQLMIPPEQFDALLRKDVFKK